ncbi:unnamed protein product [Vitrella brassicaformis CCMP3155]|uniref:Uncharacterized protein n=1 Tax=Vitrella brassicaformis (strain CCMP3155) TaxID=1169540 RepID=A0A0G4GQQ0_VITBC|nr:unnamed protein product [Vitrella brassicaformis CCMP3155]|eukprot:CEM32628.1 unnamed protein product [Vitrella brassicaformis CCMP3155]
MQRLNMTICIPVPRDRLLKMLERIDTIRFKMERDTTNELHHLPCVSPDLPLSKVGQIRIVSLEATNIICRPNSISFPDFKQRVPTSLTSLGPEMTNCIVLIGQPLWPKIVDVTARFDDKTARCDYTVKNLRFAIDAPTLTADIFMECIVKPDLTTWWGNEQRLPLMEWDKLCMKLLGVQPTHAVYRGTNDFGTSCVDLPPIIGSTYRADLSALFLPVKALHEAAKSGRAGCLIEGVTEYMTRPERDCVDLQQLTATDAPEIGVSLLFPNVKLRDIGYGGDVLQHDSSGAMLPFSISYTLKALSENGVAVERVTF